MKHSSLNTEDSHFTKGLVRLTMACNERCPFCNVPAEDYPQPTPDEQETWNEVENLIASGARTVTISGGEPTLLRRRLLSLVKRIRSRGVPFVELQTNAVLIDTPYAQELAQAGVTSAFVSLLSHVQAHHDVLCGLEGAFPKCLAGIDALLASGISVTLNPVTARSTQEELVGYVAFIGQRFPDIRCISMSAVQPHGRAKEKVELLPEYDVLSQQIPKALAEAEKYNLTLLNPYCGLPLCVGWSARQEQSVEANESRAQRWLSPVGINNDGNKSQRGPCKTCCYRTRCGGAWHAIWEHQGGEGLRAPERLGRPWNLEWVDSDGQARVCFEAEEEPSDAMAALQTPTRWMVSRDVTEQQMAQSLAAGTTDWAWRPTGEPEAHTGMLRVIRGVLHAQREWAPQRECRFVWILDGAQSPRALHRWLALAAALGIPRVALTGSLPDASFLAAARLGYGTVDISLG